MPRPSFPKSIFEFQRQFSSEEECLRFLIQSRWSEGFSCPKCRHGQFYWKAARKLLQCKKCGYQTTVTSGTIMHRTKIPLTSWFHAAYLVSTITPGISALQLQRQLGLTSYKTAFTMLHKLRAGMVREDRDKLYGAVEVDETFIGGKKAGPPGRGALGKSLVACAVEVRNGGTARARLQIIPNAAAATLTAFMRQNVVEGTKVTTDDWKGYLGLRKASYKHEVQSNLTHVHRLISNLKTWILGTHHGAIRRQHLQAYLNEYTFRFNRRRTPMAAFQTALGLGSQRLGPTYKGLYGVAKGTGKWEHPNPNPNPSLWDDVLDWLTGGKW